MTVAIPEVKSSKAKSYFDSNNSSNQTSSHRFDNDFSNTSMHSGAADKNNLVTVFNYSGHEHGLPEKRQDVEPPDAQTAGKTSRCARVRDFNIVNMYALRIRAGLACLGPASEHLVARILRRTLFAPNTRKPLELHAWEPTTSSTYMHQEYVPVAQVMGLAMICASTRSPKHRKTQKSRSPKPKKSWTLKKPIP